MNDIWMKKSATFGIVLIFVFVAWMPSVTSQFEIKSRESPILDALTINEGPSDDCTQCLDVHSWPLLDNTARVTAYSNGGYGALSHRIIRGLGVKGGEYDEIDSIMNAERVEVTFNSPQHLTFFEVRSLFARGFIDPITEEGDVDVYLNGDLVEHYDIVGVYPYIIGKVRVTVSPTILMDKIVFYVNENEDYSSYSEFTVAKIGVVKHDDISFVIPFSGIDVVKRCLFQLDMNVLDGEADDSFDVFIDDMFVYGYIDDLPINDSETWHMHSIDLFPFIMPSSGIHTVRINATGEQWSGQPTYGQVAVDTIELYNVNVTVHQGIRYLIYRQFAVDTLPLCCDTPVLCDSVDIGNQVSEAGHNLQEWGPIEPDTHGGHYGGIDDCRVTWQSADSFRWATVDLSCDVEKHSITIGLVGNGTTDPEPGTYSYIDGTVVDLEAIPDTGWLFDHWDGDVANSSSAMTTITMNDDEDVIAYFTEDYYTLDINIDGNGTVIKNPDKPYYFYGESVNLTAVPDIGWSFDYWNGDLTGNENPATICMNGSKEVTATFIEDWYTLNITTAGNGTVTATPIGPYRYNDVVTLTPEPVIGWSFAGWSGPDAGTIVDNKITMTKDMEITATFTEDWYTLNITTVGNGTVDVDPAGPYRYSTEVTLNAIPDHEWSFDSWSGDLNGSDNPETIVMDGDKDITAHFTGECYTLNITVDGNGTVIKNPNKSYYFYNESVNLTAIPDIGWSFILWKDNLTGRNNPETIVMNGDKAITAMFTEDQYILNITINGNGTVTKYPDQETYIYGTSVNLTAVAGQYWIFDHWSGNLTGSNNPSTIVMTANMSVTATFILQGWLTTMTIEGDIESPALLHMEDYVYFGERINASDCVDESIDVPYPGEPPAPYIVAWFKTDFEKPYNRLEKDVRHYPGVHPNAKIWDLWVKTDTAGNGETVEIAMTWNRDILQGNEYDFVGLFDYLSGDRLVDMKAEGMFDFTAVNGMGYPFQIICSWSHAPVAVDDYYTTNENTPLIVDAPGVLSNDYDEDGNVIWVTSKLTDPTNGTLILHADGSFDYSPNTGFVGTDSFEYVITDGDLTDIATVYITVVDLRDIDVSVGWNLISMPAYEENFDKTDLIIEFGGDYYTWDDAIANGYILGFTYGWDNGAYVDDDYLTRGDGYWLWSYKNCKILVPSYADPENHITTFDNGEGWYLVGAPYTDDLAKEQVRIHYNAVYYNWSEAVDAGIILPHLFDWDRTTQNYMLSDYFMSGYGYWMYVYHNCMLKKAQCIGTFIYDI